MGRMAELDMEIRERVAQGQSHVEISKALNIPAHWVAEMVEENDYTDYLERRAAYEHAAEVSADLDAIQYGTR